jgi:hypothetical protein
MASMSCISRNCANRPLFSLEHIISGGTELGIMIAESHRGCGRHERRSLQKRSSFHLQKAPGDYPGHMGL